MDGSPKHSPRILVVDDDDSYASEVLPALRGDGHTAVHAPDVAKARSMLAEDDFDLVLLDLRMPGTNGKVLCRELAETSRMGIIVVSAIEDDRERIALLELGADDYIVKPFIMRELLARVRAYLRRAGQAVPPPAKNFGDWRLAEDDRRLIHADGRVVALTPSEAQLMRLFCANPEMVFEREDLLAVARVRQHGGHNDRSVDNLIKRLRRKIETDPANPAHLQTVWGRGYVFHPGR